MAGGFERSVLMCHAPIVIPRIAGARAVECTQTTAAMREAASYLVSGKPDIVVVLSPHTPRYRFAYGVVEGTTLSGNLDAFGVFGTELLFSASAENVSILENILMAHSLSIKPVPGDLLDHGTLVPLYFLDAEGFRGRVIVVGFPYSCNADDHRKFGSCLAQLARERPGKWHLLVSGDMSHRLFRGAPAGFDVRGRVFDQTVLGSIANGDLEAIARIDPTLREVAAEDVVDGLDIATTALERDFRGCRVISYEGPFGVGYLVAVLR